MLADNENNPWAYHLPYNQEQHTWLMASELEAETSDNSKRSGLPRFYFIEKQRPPPISTK